MAAELRIVSGSPTDEELAAVVAVLLARGGEEAAPAPEPPSRWAAREAALRRPLHPEPGAWRHSAW